MVTVAFGRIYVELHLSFEKSIWILDLQSLSWREHTGIQNAERVCHTGTVGAEKDLVVCGGVHGKYGHFVHSKTMYSDLYSVPLEPKSLEKLAQETVHKHRASLEEKWHELPSQYRVLLAGICDLGKPHKMSSGIAFFTMSVSLLEGITLLTDSLKMLVYLPCLIVWKCLAIVCKCSKKTYNYMKMCIDYVVQ